MSSITSWVAVRGRLPALTAAPRPTRFSNSTRPSSPAPRPTPTRCSPATAPRKSSANPTAPSAPTRKIFLTQLIDPFGNAVSLTYDANLRLVAITDAIGQVTTLSYEHPTDIYKITKVTDPFGRFATFDYDASDRLIKITDVIGLTSQFTYDDGRRFHQHVDHTLRRHQFHQRASRRHHSLAGDHLSRWRQGPRRI